MSLSYDWQYCAKVHQLLIVAKPQTKSSYIMLSLSVNFSRIGVGLDRNQFALRLKEAIV